jgi:hypothetical protein
MPESPNMHGCPISGCRMRQIPVGLLMCPFHWRLVPLTLQQQVYHAWNRGNMRPNYLAVYRAAIKAVLDAVAAL